MDQIIGAVSDRVMAVRSKVDNLDIENQYFFYEGKPTVDGRAVYYLIADRLRSELFTDPSAVIYHMFKTMGEALCRPHVLVLDMSFAGVFAKDKDILNKALEDVALCISTTYVWRSKNIDVCVCVCD